MNFLFPNHLFFLLALSVPIIIHLFNFRRYKRVEFTNVRLLQDIESTTKSTRKLRNLLILLMRLLALTFIVLAFAQPFIPASNADVNKGGNHVLIYLDNSFSMEEGEGGNTLLEDGRDAAQELLRSYGDSKLYYFLTNEFSGTDNLEMSSEELQNALGKTEISHESRNLDEIMKRIKGIRDENTLNDLTAYIITDFQKSQYNLSSLDNLDSSLNVKFIKVKSENSSNLSVDSCWFESPIQSLNGIDTLWVSVSNFSDEAIEDRPVRLFINGRQTSLQSISIAPWTSENVPVVVQNNGFGTYTGRIETVDDGISQDDVLYFSFSLDSNLSVYHIGAKEEERNFRAVYETSFNYRADNEGSIDLSVLASSRVLVLNLASDLSAGLINEVKDQVKSGASLVVYSTDTSDLEQTNDALIKLGLERIISHDTANLVISDLNMKSDALNGVVERFPDNPNYPRLRSYYKIEEKTRIVKEDILSFNNNDVALRRYVIGKGNVYLYSFPLTKESGNYLEHPLFVPISINLAYISSYKRDLYYTLGREGMIEFTYADYNNESVLHLKNENIDIIPEVRILSNSYYILLHEQIDMAGIFTLSEEEKTFDHLAINFSRKESDISRYSEEDLSAFSNSSQTGNIEVIAGKGAELGSKIRMGNEAKTLWKYCVILALMFFVAETLIIKFMKA